MKNFLMGFVLAVSIVAVGKLFASHEPIMVHGAIIVEDASGDCWEWKPDDTTGAVVVTTISCP